MPLTPGYTLLASACPALQVASAVINPNDPASTPTAGPTLAAGGSGSGSLSTPFNNVSKRTDLLGRHGGGGIFVAKGLDLQDQGAGSLVAIVTAGTGMIDGPVPLAANANVTLTPAATNRIWFTQGGTLSATTSDTPPSTPSLYLGRMVTDGTHVTSIDYSGRVIGGGLLVVGYGDAGAPSVTPPNGLKLRAATNGGLYDWNPVSNAWQGGNIDSQNVKVSSGDTTPSFLVNKILAGTNVTVTKENAGANEDLKIAAADPTVKVSAGDTTPSTLDVKILAGANVTVTKENAGANEDLKIAAADPTLKVSAGDTTPAPLQTKLIAGTNVTLTKNNPGANETLTVAAADPKLKNSGTDTTEDYLNAKVVAGTGISLSTLNGGANEQISIAANPSAILDGKVLNSAADTTRDYLASTLVAGDGVSLTTVNPAANETLKASVSPTVTTLAAFNISCPIGERRICSCDFTATGAFASASGYRIVLPTNQDNNKVRVTLIENGRTGSKFYFLVECDADAAVGDYGAAITVTITPRLEGFGYTAAGGGAHVITTNSTNYRTAGVAKYTAAATLGHEAVVIADTTGASFTLTLPDVSTFDGEEILIKKTVAANTLTIAAGGTDTIEGAASVTRTAQWGYYRLVSSSVGWLIAGLG